MSEASWMWTRIILSPERQLVFSSMLSETREAQRGWVTLKITQQVGPGVWTGTLEPGRERQQPTHHLALVSLFFLVWGGRPLRECTFDVKFGKEKPFFMELPGSGLFLGRTIVPGIGMWEVSWAVLDVEGVEIGKEICSSGGRPGSTHFVPAQVPSAPKPRAPVRQWRLNYMSPGACPAQTG